MESVENFIIISIGHTAAGKTSLLRHISNKLGFDSIEEGQIKRNLLGTSYTSEDSLNEELRDRAYTLSIEQAINKLRRNRNVSIDASFHRNYRRLWVYNALESINTPLTVIWIHLFCNNIQKIRDRILKRADSPLKIAENQADKFFIYEHIAKYFDPVAIDLFPKNFNTIIYDVDTDTNSLSFSASNFCDMNNQPEFCNLLLMHISEYLNRKSQDVK